MTEAKLVPAEEGGLVPEGDGWFVLNAKEARWLDGDLGKYTGFEGKESRFPQLGININVLAPGEPMTMYHREDAQEDEGLFYPADPTALKHGAAVDEDTADGDSAYTRFSFRRTGYEGGWLPD